MKKLLRISAKKLERLMFIEYADSKYLPQAVGITFVGFDWGKGVLLFEIDHVDIVEDVEILGEEEK